MDGGVDLEGWMEMERHQRRRTQCVCVLGGAELEKKNVEVLK